ncbi:MAG: hypothetical protein U0P30_09370 [Vicinamibacterales bacterium]
MPSADATVFALTPWPVDAPCWLGPSPQLTIEEAGIAADARAERPAVLRLSLTLAGEGHVVRGYVDRGLRRAFAAGAVVWLGVDRRGGVGLSVIRGNQLICAIGAITIVPLADVSARHAPGYWAPPRFLLRNPRYLEALWIQRQAARRVPLLVLAPGGLRSHVPVNELVEGDLTLFCYNELEVARPIASLPHDRADWLDAYGIESECAGIARVGACPVVAAGTSAMLLHADGLTTVV